MHRFRANPNPNSAVRHVLQSAISFALAAAIVTICHGLPHVDVTTAALILVLVILGLAMRWGWGEAVSAAIAGCLGLDYFFLPPHGFGISNLDHWVAYVTFLVTALATGHLSARANRHRVEAVRRRTEIEKLYLLSDALSGCEHEEAIVQRLAGWLGEIPGVDAFAVYGRSLDRTWRSRAWDGRSADAQLRAETDSGSRALNADSSVVIKPIKVGGQWAGSIGIAGAGVSPGLLEAGAEAVGSAIAKVRGAQAAKEGEIARRSEELKSSIFDALAHEARGPLNSITIAATTLLSERPGDAAQQREMLSIVKEEADRMSRWIEEAARLSRTDTGGFKPNKTPQDVRGLVLLALEPMRPFLLDRPVVVQVEPSLPPAECDAELTQRVVKLLLDNALKYSPPGSPITVAGGLDGDAIEISVADSGPGVPEDEQTRIFEKHFRGSRHRSSVPGTGLGLASAKHLTEAQGGEIWVNNRPGGGAVFHLTLPVAEGTPS
jgi:two-component system, OmpR family, sensor histidine kinase KdpD